MIIPYDLIYKDLVCDDLPRKTDILNDMSHTHDDLIDPWDGKKPHAPDGFVVKYCMPNKTT